MRSDPDEGETDDLHDPDESDMDSSDEPGMLPCPECGKYVNEEAERCHHCGSYISPAEAEARRPGLFVIAVAIVLLTFAIIIFCGVFR